MYNKQRLQELAGIKLNENQQILKAIEYAKKTIGAPYVWWKSGGLSKTAPSWAENGDAPDAEDVKKNGANCTGLTNLMLRSVGKPIPTSGEPKWDGGTYAYFVYYRSVAKKFNVNEHYPEGTLLIRNYRSPKDQGHVAVVLANGKLLQSYSDTANDGAPGVNANISVVDSHAGYYYEVAVLPEDWLGIDSSEDENGGMANPA